MYTNRSQDVLANIYLDSDILSSTLLFSLGDFPDFEIPMEWIFLLHVCPLYYYPLPLNFWLFSFSFPYEFLQQCTFLLAGIWGHFAFIPACFSLYVLTSWFQVFQSSRLGLQNMPTASLPTHLTKCPGYNTKVSDGEVPVLQLWRMWGTLSLPLLLGPPWLGVVVPDRVPSIDQIQPFNCVQTNDRCSIKLLTLNNNAWNHLFVCKNWFIGNA